jgi:hypothetical protein
MFRYGQRLQLRCLQRTTKSCSRSKNQTDPTILGPMGRHRSVGKMKDKLGGTSDRVWIITIASGKRRSSGNRRIRDGGNQSPARHRPISRGCRTMGHRVFVTAIRKACYSLPLPTFKAFSRWIERILFLCFARAAPRPSRHGAPRSL